ncbi:MAG TPA: DUF3224 domain-containing protein [Chloroflexota bacterium]|jgi:hypothetical protein
MKLTATFAVTNWDERPYQELAGGTKLTRAAVTKKYSGQLDAEGTSESLMYYGSDGSATIVGLERVVGKIGGRSGSFVVESRATFAGDTAKGTWSVVAGSGTDQFKELSGKGRFTAKSGPKGSITLNYELG